MPGEVFSYAEFLESPPTDEAFFSSGDTGNSVEIDVNEKEVVADWDLSVEFALDFCDEDGIDGGRCRLLLSAFDMATTEKIPVGEYLGIDATFNLNQRVAATVEFAPCEGGACIGMFEFSDNLSNPIGVNLFWTQLHEQTGSEDEGGLHLSNGPSGLGGLTKVIGLIEVDPAGNVIALQLIGQGQDALGGDLASANFDLVGGVEPL